MSPFRCPSLFSILSFLEYEYGVFHPIGGCSALTAAMARVANRLGVEIRLDEPVEQILFAGKRAVGVRTTQGTHRADAVVVNADFARAMERLVPDHLRRRWTNRKLARKKYSCSTFMIYLGIEGKFDLPHHTIHIAEDYAKNLEDIEDRHVLSDDPSFYVQNACVTDPSLAPRGHSTLYVLAPVTHQHPNVDWSKERTHYRELLFRQIRKAGYDLDPGRIRYERVITPADWDSCYEIYRGATFNLAHSLDQMLHLRPHNRFEDLEGVYLVGGGTHPGSGLPVIFESARISSKLLLEDLGMNNEGSEAPQRKDATLANRASEAVTEAIETVSRLLNLKPAPIVNESATEPRPNP
jgi:phytoene desaturase